ncbi:methionine sulfoxide reductase A [Vibrio galatheae]|uniref:Peptide methionine sulfoxide reductase MsrA n=1 Tax=Vibrio galatheae TaxID=579748 RepID=A0A0F4NL43_9VIBR|nr:peptide-methionine (S)-S-oxide reductase [Vibrio galatheae]KJY82751.1 methionine sulfoxide reductase A [Vibrio galatheae]
MLEEIYIAGGCLWGVQEFIKHLPGVVTTEAGRANGTTNTTTSEYDGYAECVRTQFDSNKISIAELMEYLFEIIDPYSVNQQGEDIGEKYRTGIYSDNEAHLISARDYIARRSDSEKIAVEVKLLSNYVKSDEEHQDRLSRFPNDYCHIPLELLHKYKNQ